MKIRMAVKEDKLLHSFM